MLRCHSVSLYRVCSEHGRAGQKARETIVVYQQVARLRDIFLRFIAAVEHVAAQLEKGGLTKDCACERLQLQAACEHKIVVVVDGNVAAVAVENASVVSQEVSGVSDALQGRVRAHSRLGQWPEE